MVSHFNTFVNSHGPFSLFCTGDLILTRGVRCAFSPSHCEREGVADWGFGVLPDKPQSVVCPLWADCRLRCLLSLAKFGDLTFPSLPNVIFSCCQYVFQYYLQRERWTIMLSYIANNRRLLPSATEAGLFNLLLFRKAQIAVALRTFESASPLTVTSLVFLLSRLRSQ